MNICIIGFGQIGRKYYDNINNKSQINFFIVDSKFKKNNFKKNKILFLNNINKLPINKIYDLIIISTTPKNRLDVFKKLYEYKINKIIIEKPVALSTKEFNQIFKLVKKKKYIVYTNYIRQFIKEFQEIKKFIKINKFGHTLIGNFYYSKGVYYNAVHFINFIVSIYGMPIKYKVISKKKSETIKSDYLIDFILIYKSFKFYFLSFDTQNVSSSNFDIIFQRGKIEVSSSRKYKLFKIRKNTLVKNINQFSEIREKKISYKNSFKNLISLVLRSKSKKKGFVTNDLKVYKIIDKLT